MGVPSRAWEDVLFSLVLLGIGAAMIVLTLGVTGTALQDPLGPAGLPQIVGGSIIGGAIIIAARRGIAEWRGASRDPEGPSFDEVDAKAATAPREGSLVRALIFWLIVMGYVAQLRRTGFLLSTPLLLALTHVLLGERRWLLIAVTAVALTGGLYLVFDWIGVQLPPGILFSQDLG